MIEMHTLPADMLENLYASGITDETIVSAGIRQAEEHELPSKPANATGYVIPYFGVDAQPLPFQRVRIMNAEGSRKYHQKAGTGNRAYLPPVVPPEAWINPATTIFIVEGEKKALKAAQEGYACIGLGGIDSWHMRTLQIPQAAVEQSEKRGYMTIKIPNNIAYDHILESVVPEFAQIVWDERLVIIIYDTDAHGIKPEVQRAAFDLAIYLDGKGAVPRQLILPHHAGEKMGLDDFLVQHGTDAFKTLLTTRKLHFPAPIHARAWVQQRLDNRPDRETYRKVAKAVTAAMDTTGTRFVDTAKTGIYLCETDKAVYEFSYRTAELRELRNTSFGSYMMERFGIGSTDEMALKRIADQFAVDATPTDPRVVSYAAHDAVYHQISDWRTVRITPASIDIIDNGTDGVLMRPNKVAPIDETLLTTALNDHTPQTNRWVQALQEYNMDPFRGMTIPETHLVLAALFTLSPYLQRWRGMMLPFELAIAEPGSGKTAIFNLRHGVYMGHRELNTIPSDMRSWYAAIADTPFWCVDNLSDIKREMATMLSDELCRLLTSTQMTVEMRKLFTTSENVKIPINTTFAVTAVENPFRRSDLLQRTLTYRFNAIVKGERNSMWLDSRLAERHCWLVETWRNIQAFLRLVQTDWNTNYRSSNRLVHFEQSLLIMLRVLGCTPEHAATLVRKLDEHAQDVIASEDYMLVALRQFAAKMRTDNVTQATPTDFTSWAQIHPMWDTHAYMHRATNVGLYLKSHKYDIEQSVGVEVVKERNQTLLKILPTDPIQ